MLGLRWQVTETTEEPKGKNPAKNPGRLQNWDVDAVRGRARREKDRPLGFLRMSLGILSGSVTSLSLPPGEQR